MAIAAISAASPFFCGIATHCQGNPRHGALTVANGSSSSVLLRTLRSHGSSSGPFNTDPSVEEAGPSSVPCGCCFCELCGRRRLLGGISLSSLAGVRGAAVAAAGDGCSPILPRKERSVVERPSRPGWYKELYARLMEQGMRSYEEEVAGYKEELFAYLKGEGNNILELGVGTGPNFKYYVKGTRLDVFGVDPNEQMEKYARARAVAVGLPSTHFNFIQGVAEALPVRENSMDAVVGTLVLCSVQDVNAALREVKRVLKPGGLFIFIEHVAAQDGSRLRLLQGVLDPLQQLVADGCHLTRETGKDISRAGFSDVRINTASIPSVSIFSPHIYGVACK